MLAFVLHVHIPHSKGSISKAYKFIWHVNSTQKPFLLVSWKVIELPKMMGGSNIGNLQHKNTALLFKWIWRLLVEPNSLWAQVIRCKYSLGQAFTIHVQPLPNDRGPWKFICNSLLKNASTLHLATHKVRKQIGNGSDSLFWFDVWVGESPLKQVCPCLFRICASPNATMAANGFWDGFIWHWSINWTRQLRVRDLAERDLLFSINNRVTRFESGINRLV